ncbi:MAG: OmpA family protein [Bacteroidota bacterium]
MRTPLVFLFLCLLLSFSCKNASEKDAAVDDVESQPVEYDEDEATNGMEEIDFDDPLAQQKITNAAIREMVANGQMDEAEAEALIKQMEAMFSGDLNGFDPEQFGDSLNSVLNDMSNGLQTGNDSTGLQTSFPKRQPRLSEKDRAMANLREQLDIDYFRRLEEILRDWYGFSREKRNQVHRSLASQSLTPEKMDEALLTFFEITPAELDLIKKLPAAEAITTESQSKYMRDYVLPADISRAIENGSASPNFKAVIERFEYSRGSQARRFLPKAKKARDDFNKANPGWYSDDENAGDTYLDSHNNYIYLPLGDLSFADRVVSFETSMKDGNYPDGAVGVPNMTKENFRWANPKICNLGTRGVLTLEFTNNAIADVNGPDLYVFEMGAIEPTNLEISKDGVEWIEVGRIQGGTAMVDIGPHVQPKETFTYVRLTDLVTFSDLPGADVDAVAAIGGALRLNLDSAVLFDTGKYQLKESASTALEELLEQIQEMPSGTVIVEGHTDNVGDPASNKTLSENRANEVSSYLKKHLSAKYKFVVKGFGENQPVAPNDSEENKQKNRRVEILVIPSA